MKKYNTILELHMALNNNELEKNEIFFFDGGEKKFKSASEDNKVICFCAADAPMFKGSQGERDLARILLDMTAKREMANM